MSAGGRGGWVVCGASPRAENEQASGALEPGTSRPTAGIARGSGQTTGVSSQGRRLRAGKGRAFRLQGPWGVGVGRTMPVG